MTTSRTCLDSQTMRMVVLGLVFLFTCSHCMPLQTSSDEAVVKRQAGCVHPPRDLCRQSRSGPLFYHNCINALFPCGDDGFILSYAAKRLEKLAELSHIGPQLKDYLHSSENCFQEALEKEAKAMSERFVPNSETCLRFETRAITIMNECYQKHNVCAVLDPDTNEDHHTAQEHLHSVVQTFRVGGHYFNNSVVDMGISEAVRSCNGSGHKMLANSLSHTRLPVKVVWCALTQVYGTAEPYPTKEKYIELLSEKLNRSADQFMYSGQDESGACSPIIDNYDIITWFADPEDPLLNTTIGNDQGVLPPYRSPGTYIQFNEADITRVSSQCGDGIRQAGELCDFGNNLKGCDLECKVRYGYQCTPDRLAPSNCTQRTEREEQPVLCQPTSRQRAPLSAARARVPSLPLVQNPIESEQLGTSSAADTFRTSNLSFIVLIALLSLWVSRQ